MIPAHIDAPTVVHYEYRFFHEHVQNIVRDPFHEAYFMGIDNRWISRDELIKKCFDRLVLAYSNVTDYQNHIQSILKDPYHEAWVLAIDNRSSRDELVWKCYQKIIYVPPKDQSSQKYIQTTRIESNLTLEEPLTLSPGKDAGRQ